MSTNTGPWAQEQDDVLREERAENVPWMYISAEIKQVWV